MAVCDLVRTSMSFANLGGIYNNEFMDQPIPKTLDISVCEMTIKDMILSRGLLKHKTHRVFRKLCCARTAIYNGNRTEWSPIRSVIIRVITKSCLLRV